MSKGSSSVNPSGGEYAIADRETCDWCERMGEWRFRLGRPRLSTSIRRNTHVYGCGIHWKQASDYARSTR